MYTFNLVNMSAHRHTPISTSLYFFFITLHVHALAGGYVIGAGVHIISTAVIQVILLEPTFLIIL